ncbi:universal stress protein [Parasediminibacterium sp. JCM 36343]|uniref:universal stress protein n=1 Tax=Parasediminibacterium sp. JCM 36343 TaxID=3374279 RepID=UPI00397B19F2
MKSIKKILIALDDEPSAEKVALAAVQLVEALQAEVAIASIVEPRVMMTESDMTEIGMIMHSATNVEAEVEDILKKEFGQMQHTIAQKLFPGKEVELFIEDGSPYEAILKVAEHWGADLIVMGSHGRTGLAHLLMGSIADKVIRHSPIPILVIPTKDE